MEREMTRRGFLRAGAQAAAGLVAGTALAGAQPPRWTILNHDERMEYRRLGKTGLWVSAVSLGGHWKRCPYEGAEFEKNRTEIMARCLDAGFNYVDACWHGEVVAYAKALKNLGKRDRIYMGFDAYGARGAELRSKRALIDSLDNLMREASLDYVDIWRVTCLEAGGQHTYNDACELADAAEQALRQGKVRAFGVSTHDRRWADFLVREFPVVSVVVTPYTPLSQQKADGSFFQTVRKADVGVLGIKPFASNALFKGSSRPGDPFEKEDNEAARLALRHVLMNDAITSPIPGLIFPGHVENCLQAVAERRKLDLVARPAILEDPRLPQVARAAGDRLPPDYRWLREWDWV
jgi:aryl-alcohol dehydrogenase-like predicted oxidoreductase